MVKKLLRAVPMKFLQIASSIEQFGELDTMSVEEVIGRLKTHDERIRGPTENEEKKILSTQDKWMANLKKIGLGCGESSSYQMHQPFDAGRGKGRERARDRSNRGGRGGRHGGGQNQGRQES